MEGRTPLKTDGSRCVQCLNCQLVCSITYAGIFNPGMARLRISAREPRQIAFEPECTQCGLCARHCPYGAIIAAKEEG
jgi:NAD-dependent dihydropyrimidine dehydrogenase PreA subunit